MDVNERIARALGMDTEARAEHQWVSLIGDHNIEWCDRCCAAVNTCCGGKISEAGLCEPVFPDYAHSLDACLPVLADKGWDWVAGTHVEPDGTRRYFANLQRIDRVADSPAAALAECIALALEAEKSPD